MSKADFSTVAGIKAEISSIAKAGKALDTRIQKCAMAAFKHMIDHRDHTLLVDLYQALSKGARRASMAAWIMQFTQLTANTDPMTKGEKPFVLDKEKAFDLEGAKETMWFDAGKPEAAPDEILDVNKAVMSLLKKVKAAKDAGRPIKGMDAETLALLATINEPAKPVEPALM
jgi:hypothetical protein